MKRTEVRRSSRIIDAASLVLIAAGGLLYAVAFARMEELRARPYREFVRSQTELFERTREHARLTRWSHAGLGLCGTGIIVGLSAAAHAYIIGRRKYDASA